MCFTGPFTAKIGDAPYVTVTSYGFKPEGELVVPKGVEPIATPEEAMDGFLKYMRVLVQGHTQLAWRCFPAVAENGCHITARCVGIGTRKDY